MKKLSFLLSFVLVLSLVSPAWASASKELAPFLKYDYTFERGVNNPIYTDTNALLIEDLDYAYDDVTGRAYNFDIVRIDQNKKIKKQSFKNGLNRFAQYDGKSYVLNYNRGKDHLEIYDENLNSIKSIPFTKPLTGAISYKQHENYISYISIDYDFDLNEVINNVTVIDLKTLEIANNVVLPTSDIDFIFDSNIVTLTDALGQTKQAVPSKELGSVLTAHYENGYIYTLSRFDEATYDAHFIKATADGKVIQKEKLNLSGVYSQTVAGDFIFYHTFNFEDSSTITFSYNLKTGKLDQTATPHLEIYPLNDDIYLEAIRYPESTKTSVTVKNKSGQTRGSYQTEGFWLNLSEKYIFATDVIDNITQNKIIDTLTGTVVAKIMDPNHKTNDFVFIGQDKLYEYEFRYEGYPTWESNIFGSLYIINPEVNEPTKPNPYAVPSTKAWTITFTTDIDPSTVNNSNVYVTDPNGSKLAQDIKVEGKKIIINAPANGYTAGSYVLHVKAGVTSTTGKALKAGQTKAFEVQ